MVISVLNFQNSILCNVRRICHGWTVWVGDDSILWRVSTLRDAASREEAKDHFRQNDGNKPMRKPSSHACFPLHPLNEKSLQEPARCVRLWSLGSLQEYTAPEFVCHFRESPLDSS